MALDFGDPGLARRAMRAEFLDVETETRLARAWRYDGDERALHRLIQAYMRLAISMAGKFRRYGAPMGDLMQEAYLGLMKAAEKFDPDRGVRFSTYAVWWIKAQIQDYVMRNWSLVRTGSTASQKSLFFNMRRVQARLEREAAAAGITLSGPELHRAIAVEIGVTVGDVEMMDLRLSGSDFSLDAPRSDDEDTRSWIDSLQGQEEGAEVHVAMQHDSDMLRQWLLTAFSELTTREQVIVRERKLRDDPRTLESLGQELGLSKERVRQLETAAFGKMRRSLENISPEVALLL